MSKDNQQFTDLLIPRTIDGIIGQDVIKRKLRGYITSKNMPHLVFYGQAGLGKTALSEALISEWLKGLNPTEKERCYLIIKASTQKERGIAVINEYERFCDLPSIGVPFKICVWEEADGLTSAAQKALKDLLSNPLHSKNVRSIFITNYINKLSPELRGSGGRCELMPFKKVQENVMLKWLLTSIIPALMNLKLINEESREKLIVNKAEVLVNIVKVSDGSPRAVLRKLQTYVQSGIISSTDEEYTLNPFEMISLALKGKIGESSRIADKLIYSDGVNIYSLLNDLRKIVQKEDIKELRNIYKGELLMYLKDLQSSIFLGVSDEMILSGLIGKCVVLGTMNNEDKLRLKE